MYAGSTFRPRSGHIFGTHQKIDRVARRHLHRLATIDGFPSIKLILNFEGNNGPDAIKRKSPAQDEPWHFIQPFDETDTQLIELIEHHYESLIEALRERDAVRSAFEAAWLAHAVVDGLTPAHHYPYEEKLIELSGGQGIHHRTSVLKKIVMPGETLPQQLSNNWKMWGPKGLFVTHAAFEDGIATLMAPLRLDKAMPSAAQLADFQSQPLGDWYRAQAQAIDRLNLYTGFYKTGWTVSLAGRVRRELAPALVRAVTLVWYGAAAEAGRITGPPPVKARKLVARRQRALSGAR